MNWQDLRSVISKAAPIVGTAIGGPAGSAVGSLVSLALGVDETPEAVAAEIKRNPEALLKLKQLESDERETMRAYEVETLKAELADVQNAREHHKQSRMPAVITLLLTVMASGLLYAIIYSEIPEGSRDLAMMMFGHVFTLWGGSVTYWIGTTRSSSQKTQLLTNLR